MADASRITFQILMSRIEETDAPLRSVFKAANSVLNRALLGQQTGTERDVQAMLLSLDHIDGIDESSWRCGLEAGMAVLRLCLRDNTCSADELDLLIQQEDSEARPRDESGDQTGKTWQAHLQLAIATYGEKAQEADDQWFGTPAGYEIGDLKTVYDKVAAPTSSVCSLQAAVEIWPALRPLLGRVADVLQPPPGATAAATSASALEVIAEVALPFLDEYVRKQTSTTLQESCTTNGTWTCNGTKTNADWKKVIDALSDVLRKDNYAKLTLNSLTKFIAVLRGEDPAGAVAVLGQSLAAAVDLKCEAEGVSKCEVPVKTKHIRRAFTMLTAVSSYAASYRAAGDSNELDEGAREEERKKALEVVIDAFTDRSHRAGDFVVSVGADIGLQYAGMSSPRKNDRLPNGKRDAQVYNPLTTPMGLAFQWLPNPVSKVGGCPIPKLPNRIGCHIMATVIDPAQYAMMNNWGNDARFVRATPATSIRIGLRIGLLLGEPSFPISIVGHGSYSPALEMWTTDKAGNDVATPPSLPVWMYGVSAGVYVPFLDFSK